MIKTFYYIPDKNDKRILSTLELIALESDARLIRIKELEDTFNHILTIYDNMYNPDASNEVIKLIHEVVK
jgi:hypothetical protein